MGLFKKKGEQKRFVPTNAAHKSTLHKNLDFTATEQYKVVRANLDFTIPIEEKCPVIGVTSSMRGEGKSTTAINLSYVFASKGSKVLLIDADLRIPSIAKKLDLEHTSGLADLLKSKGSNANTAIQPYELENWFVLTSGDIPPNPSELLGSKRMERILNELRQEFDYIVIDLPPVNIVSDAVAISKFITGMIIVVREEHTEKKELERCFRQLKMSNIKLLGCVMNGTKSGSKYYSKYKKYRTIVT